MKSAFACISCHVEVIDVLSDVEDNFSHLVGWLIYGVIILIQYDHLSTNLQSIYLIFVIEIASTLAPSLPVFIFLWFFEFAFWCIFQGLNMQSCRPHRNKFGSKHRISDLANNSCTGGDSIHSRLILLVKNPSLALLGLGGLASRFLPLLLIVPNWTHRNFTQT